MIGILRSLAPAGYDALPRTGETMDAARCRPASGKRTKERDSIAAASHKGVGRREQLRAAMRPNCDPGAKMLGELIKLSV